MSPGRPTYYQRWNLQHRLQHGALALSMLGLILTGLAIKFHYMDWAKWTFALFGGFHNNLIVHKTSATILILVSVWHLVFLLMNFDKNWRNWAMMPTLKDLTDAGHHMLYLLNIRKEPPQYDRYTYLEKFEYLSIFWGMVVMGLSGFSLWFPEIAGQVFPRFMLDGLRIVHGNEALVASIALLYGHFFSVHFNPMVFPSSPVWYSGKISLEHMLEEHPAEYERLVASGKLPAVAAGAQDHHGHGLSLGRRLLAAVQLVLYSAMFYYMLMTFLPKLLA